MSNLKQKRFVDTDYFHEQLDSTTVEVEGSHISATETKIGYLKDVEILGNTIQDASNLADIRSVGDKVEGQELYEIPVLSRGKNLFDGELEPGTYQYNNGVKIPSTTEIRSVHKIKVNPNSNYLISSNKPTENIGVYYYDSKENFIKSDYDGGQKIVTTEDTHFIAFRFTNLDLDRTVQLEEGTVSTPYEPYQEYKLTILSPVQLEKVGDVADRIICKDEVWGVEKNVIDKLFNGSENWVLSGWAPQKNTIAFKLQNTNNTNLGICDKFILNRNNTTIDTEAFNGDSVWNEISIRINKSKLSTQDVTGFKKWLSDNTVLVMYSDNTPTFIPLPHDQQVKLRTFANKTNISFLTEIEGTIKAQVPKSLGATVNTHTEQISNLNKELDRVKKLEESTVSTIETESDFTTVEATSNGYFEDVKLEGKTLVNLAQKSTITLSNTSSASRVQSIPCIRNMEKGKVYTLFAKCTDYSLNGVNGVKFGNWGLSGGTVNDATICKGVGGVVYKFTIKENATTTLVQVFIDANNTEGSATLTDFVILEGDYTQNPPSFFEGLKSVGQSATTSEDGADEISVESVNENLFDGELEVGGIKGANGEDDNKDTASWRRSSFIKVNSSNMVHILKQTGSKFIFQYDENKTFINYTGTANDIYSIIVNSNCKYIRLTYNFIPSENIYLGSNANITEHIPHKSDKKRLLYYNEETQTWEKPILREWDSIEKHANGKYYYHQRSGEVVFDGSEDWGVRNMANENNTIGFGLYPGLPNYDINSLPPIICDRFACLNANALWVTDEEGTTHAGDYLHIRILKSRLSTQDAEGFKQWLQANNVTVVYQLAEEKVYECTNIDLITYTNETNYIVESGAISPRTTLKVHNNISNVVSLLQKKVSLLEAELYNYKVNQNLRQLRTFYKSDYANFGVATLNNYSVEPTSIAITPYGYDLFEIFKEVIAQGKDKYDRIELEEYIDFYLMTFVFDFDMVFELFDLLDANEDIIEDEPVEEEPPTEEEEDVVEDTPTILPNLPGDEATPIPLI